MGIPNQDIVAAGAITVTGTITGARGVTSVALASSIFSVTLDTAIDATECVIMATIRGTTEKIVVANHTSDTVKAFATFTASTGATADSAFDFIVHRLN